MIKSCPHILILPPQPSELEDALLQRDKIIRQLTARLQETAGLKSLSTSIEEPDYLQETQRLSQQVVMLQQQLAQVRNIPQFSVLFGGAPSLWLSGCAPFSLSLFKFCL